MAIMKQASSSSLCSTANQFGVAACMVGLANHGVCQLLKEIASNKIIHLVNPQHVIDGFNDKGFLNCMTALAFQCCALWGGEGFYKQKGYASVILQAMVDHWGWFMNIYTGWVSSSHNACMFRNSPLPGLVEEGRYASGMEETVIHGVAVPPIILVDAAYSLKPWLMKLYEGNITNLQKVVFNYRLGSCRMAVECMFGRLKGRWRVLMCRLEMESENITAFVVAAYRLHNICESCGEVFKESWEEA
ncbi:hypothetical protein Y1Q_0008499 [Alligator mississippiensis]|uniref:DDE Tnp4 domain-containing protein n=1 Tax=Alligator mississippiensis TaxID=8496 RepID=A0A151M1I1_ALLMI|nr:hypothetical protein Y1Q_0008499 [Alligator mississippiensis]